MFPTLFLISLHNLLEMRYDTFDIAVVHRWDEQSLKLLYRHYYKALVLFSIQMVEKLEIAEELVQDTFVDTWQHHHLFSNQQSLKAYLYNTVRNNSISYLRHQRVEVKRIEMFEKEYQLMRDEDDSESDREEIFRQLLLGIESLSPKLRQIFLLSIEGKTCADIAKELGITPASVKTQRQRGFKILRQRLSPEALLLLFMLIQ